MLLYLLRHGEKVINLQIKKRGKIIAEVFNYIDEANYAKSSAELVNRILKNVPYIKSIGYAGWKSKKSLMQNLNWSIGKKIGKIKKVDLKVIKEAVLACNKFICKRKVYIFIFLNIKRASFFEILFTHLAFPPPIRYSLKCSANPSLIKASFNVFLL